MTSKPLVKRTFATLRSAEFGFFGVVVYTRVHTPRFCGLPPRAGTLLLVGSFLRPLRSNWLIVGMFSRCRVRSGPETRPLKLSRRVRQARNALLPRRKKALYFRRLTDVGQATCSLVVSASSSEKPKVELAPGSTATFLRVEW